MWAQAIFSDNFNLFIFKNLLKQIVNSHVIIKIFFVGLKINQYVYIAFGSLLISQIRPKQSNVSDAEFGKL